MARRKVEVDGLKAQPCRKAASSLFVCLLRIMLFARCCCFVQVEKVVPDLGASGMFQRPLVVFLFPFIMICPSLMMWTWYLEKRATVVVTELAD
jgi:hypothetical protein